ncbi:MAG: hypothetical protein ACYC6V_08330, partial [Bacillota bacterium]
CPLFVDVGGVTMATLKETANRGITQSDQCPCDQQDQQELNGPSDGQSDPGAGRRQKAIQ